MTATGTTESIMYLYEQAEGGLPQETAAKNSLMLASSTIAEGVSVPVSPEIHLPIQTVDFNSLTDMLLELERQHSCSTLDVLRRYMGSDEDIQEDVERWIDLVFLYLGTNEVRRFARP